MNEGELKAKIKSFSELSTVFTKNNGLPSSLQTDEKRDNVDELGEYFKIIGFIGNTPVYG